MSGIPETSLAAAMKSSEHKNGLKGMVQRGVEKNWSQGLHVSGGGREPFDDIVTLEEKQSNIQQTGLQHSGTKSVPVTREVF